MRTSPNKSRKPVYELIRQKIEDMIRSGELRVGDKLPSERKLAEQFGASRNSVRESIRLLTEHGIVVSKHGDGTYVQSDKLGSPTVLDSFLNKSKRIHEIFELRRIIEPEIAALAAHGIKRKDVEKLKLLVFEQKRRQIAQADDFELDSEFHLMLAVATGNSVLIEIMSVLTSILDECRRPELQTDDRKTASLRTHVKIVDALERQDSNAARSAMKHHLMEIEQLIYSQTMELV